MFMPIVTSVLLTLKYKMKKRYENTPVNSVLLYSIPRMNSQAGNY